MLELVHDHDALFIFDEVQTGVGTTGTAWAYQQLGVQPDIVAFAKKVQLGGIMAGGRVDEVPDNVFAVSGRINSTWGGGLVDMVRSRRLLEIIEAERPDRGGRPQGRATSSPACRRSPTHIRPGRQRPRPRAVRGLSTCPTRARGIGWSPTCARREHVIVLPCGERSIRFRPALSVSEDEIDEAVRRGRAGRSARLSRTPVEAA